jgi:hypothetical protein
MKLSKHKKLCGKEHPHLKYDNGSSVRCVLTRNHIGNHFDSFAMRAWENSDKHKTR